MLITVIISIAIGIGMPIVFSNTRVDARGDLKLPTSDVQRLRLDEV